MSGGPESLSVALGMWFLPDETDNKSLDDVTGPNSTTTCEFRSVNYMVYLLTRARPS
jgi:hypothetical protein